MRCLVWLLLVLGLACGVGDGRAAVVTFLGGTSVQEFATTVTPATDGWRYAGYDPYAAYGTRVQEASAGGAPADRFRANSKEEDPTGLINEGFRYRDLETGTFISRDPLGFVDGPNVYCYVRQNPWSAFDPEGLAMLIGDGECGRGLKLDKIGVFARDIKPFLKGYAGVVAGLIASTVTGHMAAPWISGQVSATIATAASGASGGYIGNGVVNKLEGEDFNKNGGAAAASGIALSVLGHGVAQGISKAFPRMPAGTTARPITTSGGMPQPLELPGAGTVGAANNGGRVANPEALAALELKLTHLNSAERNFVIANPKNLETYIDFTRVGQDEILLT